MPPTRPTTAVDSGYSSIASWHDLEDLLRHLVDLLVAFKLVSGTGISIKEPRETRECEDCGSVLSVSSPKSALRVSCRRHSVGQADPAAMHPS